MKGATININKEMEMGKKMFYRIDEKGNARILYESGEMVTRIDDANVYPIDSSLSARYEHPEGITLTIEDAQKLGIEKE